MEYLTLFMQYGLPVLPYACIAFVVYKVMGRFVKPLIQANKSPDGFYHNKWWRYARRAMVFYPMALGALCALPFALNVGYAAVAGLSSQLLYHLLKDFLKKRGIELPRESTVDFNKSLMMPPETAQKLQKLQEEQKGK